MLERLSVKMAVLGVLVNARVPTVTMLGAVKTNFTISKKKKKKKKIYSHKCHIYQHHNTFH